MNKTQLRQGSLNGLRRQVSECLDSAYNKGYEDGKKEPTEVKAVNVEDTDEYQKGYKAGVNDGYKEYKYLVNWFCTTCFVWDEASLFPEYKRRQADGCCLEDIIADVGFIEVLNRAKAYDKENRADENIKVGDIVYYGEDMMKAVVLEITEEQGVTYAVMLDENGLNINEELSGLKFIRHTDEVEQLLSKVKESEGK